MSIGLNSISNESFIPNETELNPIIEKDTDDITVDTGSDQVELSPTATAERQLVDTGKIRQAGLQGFRLSPSGFDYDLIAGLKDNRFVTAEFIREVEAMAVRLDAKPEHVLAAMSFETGGTFDPSITNSIGATGLIQFLSSTARGLGTTTSALRQMTSVEQLEFVEKYFQPFTGNLETLAKVYTSILSGSPKSSPDDVLFRRGTRAYDQNPLDWNRDGVITAQEATTPVAARMFGGNRAVQQALLDGGYVPADQRARFADGIWGRNTAAAVATFQTANNLFVTENLDEITGRRLFNIPDPPPIEPPSVGPLPNVGLTRGDEGVEVEKLQDLLIRFGDMTEEQKASGPGIFGPRTEQSLQSFQRNLGVETTGTFDTSTRDAAEKILNGVRRGERGDLVERMQDRLVELGFMTAEQKATGPGIFGRQTEASLKDFQRRDGLTDDGVLGPITYKALYNAGVIPPEELYTLRPDVIITPELAPKLDRLAREYLNRTETKLIVTSGYRPPERQAIAMADLIESRGRTYVRNLYRDKTAVNAIIAGYDRGGRTEMTRVIENQVANGVFISSHLRNNAVDFTISTNERVLREIMAQLGGTVLDEGNHYHVRLN